MKKIITLILTLGLVLGCLIPNFSSYADNSITNTIKVYVDKGESITTAYPTFIRDGYCNGREVKAGDPIISRDISSLQSLNTSIVTINRQENGFDIVGKSGGVATVQLVVKVNESSLEYTYVFQYQTRVITAFDNVTFTYNYDKVTVNYGSGIPDEITPVFSKDGQTWSENATITRTVNDSNKIYKAYRINGVVSGSIKALEYNKIVNTDNNTSNKDVKVYVGDTYSVKDDIAGEYSYYLINGRSNITFDEANLSFTANETGNTKLTIATKTVANFNQDGSITKKSSEYNYNIKVTAKPNEEGSGEGGEGQSGNGDNNGNNNSNNSSNNNSNNNTNNNTNNSSSNNNTNGNNGSSSNSSNASNGSSSKTSHSPYNVTGTWKKDGTGWWFELTDGTYPVYEWKCIDDEWYFFNKSGYMESNCYRFGCWLESDGHWNTRYSGGTWKSNGTGWWYEDGNWYPTSEWLMIDGYWYYFKADGYMAANEYIDGYWLGSDGAWR